MIIEWFPLFSFLLCFASGCPQWWCRAWPTCSTPPLSQERSCSSVGTWGYSRRHLCHTEDSTTFTTWVDNSSLSFSSPSAVCHCHFCANTLEHREKWNQFIQCAVKYDVLIWTPACFQKLNPSLIVMWPSLYYPYLSVLHLLTKMFWMDLLISNIIIF